MYLIRVTRCETRGVLGGLDLCPFQQKNENENVLFVVTYLHQEDVFLTVEVETFLGNRSCVMNLRRTFFALIFIFAIPLCMLLLAPQLFLVSLRKLLKSFIDVCLHAKVVPCLPVSLLLEAKYFLFLSGNRNTCCSFFSAFFFLYLCIHLLRICKYGIFTIGPVSVNTSLQ